jgi:hypothetical protein
MAQWGGSADFSSHVPALLGTWSLIFDMDTSSSSLDHHLRKLHYRRQT